MIALLDKEVAGYPLAQVLTVSSIIVTVLLLLWSLSKGKRKAKIRPWFDIARALVQIIGVTAVAWFTGVTTAAGLVIGCVLLGLVIGAAQGLNLILHIDAGKVFATRSVVGIIVWGFGLVLMQAAGLANRVGLVRVGQGISWLSIGITVGLILGRYTSVDKALRAAASGSLVAIILAGSVLGVLSFDVDDVEAQSCPSNIAGFSFRELTFGENCQYDANSGDGTGTIRLQTAKCGAELAEHWASLDGSPGSTTHVRFDGESSGNDFGWFEKVFVLGPNGIADISISSVFGGYKGNFIAVAQGFISAWAPACSNQAGPAPTNTTAGGAPVAPPAPPATRIVTENIDPNAIPDVVEIEDEGDAIRAEQAAAEEAAQQAAEEAERAAAEAAATPAPLTPVSPDEFALPDQDEDALDTGADGPAGDDETITDNEALAAAIGALIAAAAAGTISWAEAIAQANDLLRDAGYAENAEEIVGRRREEHEQNVRDAEDKARRDRENEQLDREQAERDRLRREREEAEARAREEALRDRDTAYEQLERIREAAARRGWDDVVDRLDEAFNEDGSINPEYVDQLAEVLRNRIGREIGTPPTDPSLLAEFLRSVDSDYGDVIPDFLIDDIQHAMEETYFGDGLQSSLQALDKSAAARMVLGMASGGASEAYFQSRILGQAIMADIEAAEAAGVPYERLRILHAMADTLIRENAPINTAELMLKGKNVTTSQVLMSIVGDLGAMADFKEAATRLRGFGDGIKIPTDGPSVRPDGPPGAPRPEGPRVDGDAPRVDGDAPRVDGDAPRVDGPEGPRVDGDAPRPEGPRVDGDAPRVDGDAPRVDGPEGPRVDGDAPRVDGDAPRVDGDAPRVDGDAPRVDAPEGPRVDGPDGGRAPDAPEGTPGAGAPDPRGGVAQPVLHPDGTPVRDIDTMKPGTKLEGGDVRSAGYTPAQAEALQRVAAEHDVIIATRTTNPQSTRFIESGDAVPKPIWLKNKSISELDELIGGPRASEAGKVGFFQPTKPQFLDGSPVPAGHPAWERYEMRMSEYKKLDAGLKELAAMEKIRVVNGVVELRMPDGSFKPFAGDIDPVAILDAKTGKPVSGARYDEVINALKASEAKLQHGAEANMIRDIVAIKETSILQKYPHGSPEYHAAMGRAEAEARTLFESLNQNHLDGKETVIYSHSRGTYKGPQLNRLDGYEQMTAGQRATGPGRNTGFWDPDAVPLSQQQAAPQPQGLRPRPRAVDDSDQ